jgi:osmoprotectant transport system substrate-binding protein
MRIHRMLALGASLLVLASACTTGGGSPTTVKIGSAGFYESQLVAEMYAQVLEANGYTIERHHGLGERPATETSLESGAIDLKPEYLGGYLEHLNKGKGEASGDPAATAAKLKEYTTAKGFVLGAYTPGQDQDGFAVRPDTASQLGLATMSDLGPVAGQLVAGVAPACPTNPLCLDGLAKTYGITFKEVKTLSACSPDGVTALVNEAIDVYQVCTTQPGIRQFDLVLLDDDKRLQPAQNIAPVMRSDFLDRVRDRAKVIGLLDQVSAGLTTEVLLDLGVKIDVDKQDIDDVATEWLVSQGLVPAPSG